MAAIDFPDSPNNGDVHVVGTKRWTWNSSTGTWDGTSSDVRNNFSVTTAATSQSVVRNITISQDDPTGGIDGDLWFRYE